MSRIQCVLAFICNVLIVLLVAYSVRATYLNCVNNPQIPDFQFLRYFTLLSNLYAGIASLMMLPFSIRALASFSAAPQWMTLIKYTATLSVAVTFVTVLVFLGPTQGYKPMFSGESMFLHGVIPVLALLCIICLEPQPKLRFAASFTSLIPVVLYGIVYFFMVVICKRWPDFYGFTFGGKIAFVPLSMVGMLIMTYLLGLGTWKLRELMGRVL